jgi:LAO/AO transport system kinase
MDDLPARVLAGDRRALARAISCVEAGGAPARSLVAALYPRGGRAHVIGVTGAPGAGKSSLVNGLAKAYRRRGQSVGIIAVDPTSPFSGGAILGDRIRMNELTGDPGIFIRSMASRGSLGGLAAATGDAVKLLDAAGYDKIFVETVGAGQTEVDIARTAHTTIVACVPGLGDDIQAIKAGILEIADIFAVNQADREGADAIVMALEMMLELSANGTSTPLHHGVLARVIGGAPAPSLAWRPPICKTVATTGAGVAELLAEIERHLTYLRASGRLAERERLRAAAELENLLRQELLRQVIERTHHADMTALVEQIAGRQIDVYAAADRLLESAGA